MKNRYRPWYRRERGIFFCFGNVTRKQTSLQRPAQLRGIGGSVGRRITLDLSKCRTRAKTRFTPLLIESKHYRAMQ